MPIVELVEWYSREVLGETLNKAAAEGRAPYLFLDEVQNLAEWAPQLKHLVDLGKVRALVTGSSAVTNRGGPRQPGGPCSDDRDGATDVARNRRLAWFGDVPRLLPPNGLAPLKDKTFWQGLRAHGEIHREVRDRAFVRSPSVVHIPWPRLGPISPGMSWRTSSMKPSSRERSHTTFGWVRAARSATSICSKKSFDWRAATSGSPQLRRYTSKRSARR